jgi:hypothetical protein
VTVHYGDAQNRDSIAIKLRDALAEQIANVLLARPFAELARQLHLPSK